MCASVDERREAVVGQLRERYSATYEVVAVDTTVTLLVRGATLAESMSHYLVDALAAAGVEVRLRSEIAGGAGAGRLEHLAVRDLATGVVVSEPTDAVFVLIGALPRSDWLPQTVVRDRWGYLLTGADVIAEGGRRAWPHDGSPQPLETAVRGVFAVGDVRRGSVKRVASAVGEGSVVVASVHAHLARRMTHH